MKKFIVIYHAPSSAMEDMKDATPEEMEVGKERWNKWAKKIGDGLVDMGHPLGNGQVISKAGSFESKSDIMGYSILQAETMNEAKKMLHKHPHMGWAAGCKIEVFEAMPMGM